MTDKLLEILKYTIPAIVVLIATAIIVNKFLKAEAQKRQMTVFEKGLAISLPLRLQAYERLSVLLERMQTRAIIPRVFKQGMTVRDFQYAMISSIKEEFQHNLSQQIYVSSKVWGIVVSVKEQEMAIINQMAATLKPEAPAQELHKRILDHFMERDDKEISVDMGLKIIRNEAKLVLSHQG